MKVLLPAVITILFAIGCAPTSSDPPASISARPGSLLNRSSHDFEPLDVPELAKRKVLDASGLPNGKYRAIAIDDGWNLDCYLVEVASKKVKFTFSGPTKGSYYAEISPQESYLASSRIFDQKITLWSIETGEVTIELPGHEVITQEVTFSPDEKRLASLSVDGEICVWDISERAVVVRKEISLEAFESFQFDSNDRLSVQLRGSSMQLAIPVTVSD